MSLSDSSEGIKLLSSKLTRTKGDFFEAKDVIEVKFGIFLSCKFWGKFVF